MMGSEIVVGIFAVWVIGGIVAIWILQTLIDVIITSRVMDDPVNGKILATVSAYFLASTLYLFFANSFAGLLMYLPGALLIGWLQYRKGLSIRAKMAAENVGATFE